jgi:hypothetical protein
MLKMDYIINIKIAPSKSPPVGETFYKSVWVGLLPHSPTIRPGLPNNRNVLLASDAHL